jgi:radical SAM superfamily enzyme YgiQ (UPF0313 family)
MTIARVFPRRTNATPVDDYAFVGDPPLSCFIPEDITEVHVSVTFTWDLEEAERLAHAWSRIAPVKIGGPATGMKGEGFTPGMYLKPGYVITSRGCPNRCWFCSVPEREGREVRELPITEGWNLLDDNILACSDGHFLRVCKMLLRYKGSAKKRPHLTGGLEAKRLTSWHVSVLKKIKPEQVFFAYDTPDDLAPLQEASEKMREAGFTRSVMRCYVLMGYPGDTIRYAEERLRLVRTLGFCPMAMLYRDKSGAATSAWKRVQRAWSRPAAIYGKRDNRHLENIMEVK